MWCRGNEMICWGSRKKAGFTLMELMVYIALLGGIVLIAGQAFSDSTKMRVRTQNMLEASQVAGNVGTMLEEDIAQLGAKSSKENDDPDNPNYNNIDTTHKHDIYMDPDNDTESARDSSSFNIVAGSETDSIAMRRIRYDEQGHFNAIEQVTWFVEDHVLKRSCQSFSALTENEDCPSQDPNVVIVAEDIHKFKLTPGTPTTEVDAVSVLPSPNEADRSFRLVPRLDGDKIEPLNVAHLEDNTIDSLSGFYINYDLQNNEAIDNPNLIKINQVFMATDNDVGSWNAQCNKVTLEPHIEYEISFSMPRVADDPTGLFCPERDLMSVGFRYAENGQKPDELNDFQFYPPTTSGNIDTGHRRMRFTTSNTIENVCLGFTFALFSPVASTGSIKITDLRLKKIPSSNYRFLNCPTQSSEGTCPNNSPCCDPKIKTNAKAIKMEIAVIKNGEAGAETVIIPIPSNGLRD